MIKIIKSDLLNQFSEIKFGFSTKIGLERKPPFHFNMLKSVNDLEEIVDENRESFFNKIGLNCERIVYQKQIHSDFIKIAEKPGIIGESDSLITNQKNLGLAISSADCAPIFIYDFQNKVISGIHSGWRGTQKQIVSKTLLELKEKFNSEPENMVAFIGPSISQKNYEVGAEFNKYFDRKYLFPKNGKYLLDVKTANYDMLANFGIPKDQIEVSQLCSFDEDYLHSYRREGEKSGRAFGVIAIFNS